MASWRERESATQARSREENESTARTIRLTAAEYEVVRAYATHFATPPTTRTPRASR
jgi:hypothetical protein